MIPSLFSGYYRLYISAESARSSTPSLPAPICPSVRLHSKTWKKWGLKYEKCGGKENGQWGAKRRRRGDEVGKFRAGGRGKVGEGRERDEAEGGGREGEGGRGRGGGKRDREGGREGERGGEGREGGRGGGRE
jgi:hypothetical protein